MNKNLSKLIQTLNKNCKKRKAFLEKMYIREKKKILALPKDLEISTIEIIGSLPHNTYHPNSDLDINLRCSIGLYFDRYMWSSFGRMILEELKDSYVTIEVQLVRKCQLLLVQCVDHDGLKIDITVNNNKCIRNAIFYKIFGGNEIFRNTSRLLKLYSRKYVGRRIHENEGIVYPGGFFYDMLVAQIIVEDNKVPIKTAFDRVTLEMIEKPVKKNKYTTEKCLKSCVEHILRLKTIDKLVFDYEECQFNHWEFKKKEHLIDYQIKMKGLLKVISEGKYPMEDFLEEEDKKKEHTN